MPKLSNRCFCWFPSAMLVFIQVDTSMASPYKSLKIWVKHFFWYLIYEVFFWPESWRGALYIYLPLFPRFRNLSIEWFWLLFWSILNDMTLKTSNWLLVYILWYHQFLIFQFCDVSLNNFLILCVWNKLAS